MSEGLSPNLQHLEPSPTIAISQEAKRRQAAGADVIDLGAGGPDSQSVDLTGARPVLVPGDPEWGVKVSVRELARMLPAATGLLLCSPCNPTGSVYTHAELKAIAQWARERKVWVITDEIYRRIHYGTGPAPSFLDLPDELLTRVVVIYGVSKAYAMTGWRIGLALAPAPVANADRKSTRLNSSHQIISYAVFCLKKKNDHRRGEDGRRGPGGVGGRLSDSADHGAPP